MLINNVMVYSLTNELRTRLERCKVADIDTFMAAIQEHLPTLPPDTDKRELENAVVRVAELGLNPAPACKLVYLLSQKRKDGNNFVSSVRVQVSYRGDIALMKRWGCKNIHADVVYSKDQFAPEFDGQHYRPNHRPHIGAERGEPVAAYACVVNADGFTMGAHMMWGEIMAIKARPKISNPVWDTDPGEMAKKTVIHRVVKLFPQFDFSDLDGFDDAPPATLTPPAQAAPGLDLPDAETLKTSILELLVDMDDSLGLAFEAWNEHQTSAPALAMFLYLLENAPERVAKFATATTGWTEAQFTKAYRKEVAQ